MMTARNPPSDEGKPASGEAPGRAARPAQPPAGIPDYELIKRIGCGSYGSVWLGRTATGSYRAIKVVYRSAFEDERPFEREFAGIKRFEPISRSHPSQIDILHVGRNDRAGYFYYVMELADDESAEEALVGTPWSASAGTGEAGGSRDGDSTGSASATRPIHPETYSPRTLRSQTRTGTRLPVEACLRIALSLTDALEHLHAHGLVHRDIKPSNVIFVRGRPKLADIGLVARADDAMSIVGTEGYLPPEGTGKPQADIYSLGKVLYELATGMDRKDFPRLPAGMADEPDHDAFVEFNEIILRAGEESVARRYPSVRVFRQDLLLLAAGRSVRRFRVFESRLASLKRIAAGLTFFSLLTVGASVYHRTQARQAEESVETLDAAVRLLELERVETMRQIGRNGASLGMLAHRVRENPRDAVAVPRLLSVLMYGSYAIPLAEFAHGAEWRISDAALGPHGRWLVTMAEHPDGDPDYTPLDGLLSVWDLSDPTGGRLVLRQIVGKYKYMDHPNVGFDPAGERVVIPGGWTGRAEIWELSDAPRRIREIPQRGPVFHAEFSPDGRRLIMTTMGGADVRDAETGASVAHLPHAADPNATPREQIRIGRYTADGMEIVTASAGSTCAWDASTGALLHRLAGEPIVPLRMWKTMAMHPSASRLIQREGGNPFFLKTWDVRAGDAAVTRDFHQYPIRAVAVSPSGRTAASAANDQTIRVWDWSEALSVRRVLSLPSPVFALAFSPNGEVLASGSRNGTIRLWSWRTGEPLCEPFRMSGQVRHLVFTRDGARLLAFNESTARMWDIRPGAAQPELLVHDFHGGSPLMVGGVSYRADGETLATTLVDRFPLGYYRHGPFGGLHATVSPLRLWDPYAGTPTWQTDRLDRLARPGFSAGGGHLLDFGAEGVRIVSAETGEDVVRIEGNSRQMQVAVSSDDRWAVATEVSGAGARLWNLSARELQHTWTVDAPIACVQFSPDSTRVFFGLQPDAGALYDVQSGERTAAIPAGFPGFDVRFSPDSQLLCAWRGAALRIHSAVTLEPLSDWVRHEEPIVRTGFSPDSRHLLTASMDRSVKIWDVSPAAMVPDLPLLQVGRALTHGWVISDAQFSPLGDQVAVASWDTGAQVWSPYHGLPLTGPLPHPDVVLALDFDPTGRWLATGCADGTARLWEIPQASGPAPDWLPRLAEALAGFRRNEASGDLERIDASSAEIWQEIRALAEADDTQDSYAAWARWFLADRATRTLSPSSPTGMAEYLKRLARMDSPELPLRNDVPERVSSEMLLRFAPMDPRHLARMAHKLVTHSLRQTGEDLSRAAWLSSLALQLDAESGMGWWVRAEVLQAEKRLQEAQEAIAQALARDPDDPNAWLAQALIEQEAGMHAQAYQSFKRAATLARLGLGDDVGTPGRYVDPMLRLAAHTEQPDSEFLRRLAEWNHHPGRNERYRTIGRWVAAWSEESPSSIAFAAPAH